MDRTCNRRSQITTLLSTVGFAVTLLGGTVVSRAAPPPSTATGTILSKTFQPATSYRRYPAGHPRGLLAPEDIPIAECFVFEIQVQGLPGAVRYSLNTVAGRNYRVGQTVRVEYVKRAIVALRSRVYVRQMWPVE